MIFVARDLGACCCSEDGESKEVLLSEISHALSAGYMVVNPISPSTWSTIYPGRHILVDIGTGRYKSGSIPWFTEIYEEKGATFDDIFGDNLSIIARPRVPARLENTESRGECEILKGLQLYALAEGKFVEVCLSEKIYPLCYPCLTLYDRRNVIGMQKVLIHAWGQSRAIELTRAH